MRKVWLAAFAAVVAGPALAGDIGLPIKAQPYAIPYTWTGGYVGAYLGDGFSSFPIGFGSNNAEINALSPGVIGPANSALLAGGIVGANYQVGSIVLGAEIQGGFTGFNSSTSGFENIMQTHSSVPWDVAVLARFGFLPHPRVLLYGVVGGEGAEIDHSVSISAVCSVTVSCSASNSNVHFGWTAGFGGEWAPEIVAPLRLRAEYRYVDVGTTAVNLAVPVGETPITISSSDTARWNQVVVGLLYPF